jgi:hypothetical protein
MARPREIEEAGLFTYDFRHDSSKFWFLERPIRPVVQVGTDGRFIRPGMMEREGGTLASNVAFANFPDALEEGQIWVIDNISIINGGGAPRQFSATINIDGVAFHGPTFNIDNLTTADLSFTHPFYIDEQVGIVITNGEAASAYSVSARRVA